MVKTIMKRNLFLALLILISLTSARLIALPTIQVTAMMNDELVEGEPLQGTITVTHDISQKVDPNGFSIENKPLKAEFTKSVRMEANSPLVISFYNFFLPPMPKGLQILPQISVTVDGRVYKTISSSFQISARSSVSPPPLNQATPPNQAPPQNQAIPNSVSVAQLKLEAKIDGPATLVPGQKTKLVYKFLYTGSIELSNEVLPLLEAKGFKKVGDVQHRDYQEGEFAVSEFSLQIEADKPGIYTFPSSSVEGYAYQIDTFGNKVYLKNILRSETPPLTITVTPFPDQGKPASYNGAIGIFDFKATLASDPKVAVGDKLLVSLEITGNPSSLADVPAPDLCCQPGFSGMFLQSDLPPISSIQGNTKKFLVDMRPLSIEIKEIPAIEFSSWDPSTNSYLVLKSAPIPITVIQNSPAGSVQEEKNAPLQSVDKAPLEAVPGAIEIPAIFPLTTSNLHDLWGGTWWSLLFIPAFGVVLYLQVQAHADMLQKRATIREPSGEELLQEAFSSAPDSASFYNSVKAAFIALLFEKGIIQTRDVDPEKLPSEGSAASVKAFLRKLDETRFAGKTQPGEALLIEAQTLYKKIKGEAGDA